MCKFSQGKGRRTFLQQGWRVGKESWEGCSAQRVHFHWLSPWQERIVFFLLGSATVAGCESSMAGLLALFNWGFCLLIFYIIVGSGPTNEMGQNKNKLALKDSQALGEMNRYFTLTSGNLNTSLFKKKFWRSLFSIFKSILKIYVKGWISLLKESLCIGYFKCSEVMSDRNPLEGSM